jgi:hypothetical protein
MSANRPDFHCFRCGTAYEFTDRIGRRDACPKCDADLHCCRNCRHYSPGAHNQCNETQADWVREKDRANYCDYFDPLRGAGARNVANPSQNARARFEDLFKK